MYHKLKVNEKKNKSIFEKEIEEKEIEKSKSILELEMNKKSIKSLH